MAVFLDLENLHGGCHNESAGVPLGLLVQQIEEIGRAGGIKPVRIFSFDNKVKNAADIELCEDVLQVAHESPWMDVFVIATGDGGFIPSLGDCAT